MAYKSLEDIIDVIRESVDVIDVMKPIYNFKASEQCKTVTEMSDCACTQEGIFWQWLIVRSTIIEMKRSGIEIKALRRN